ncbi:hypothetical protein VP01_1553g3 [Puccinia sorghi]|uniref:Uncharacterized protein n=1 Tax=Puccinia sorghi TaxID=27349 RepID=A0A0L6VIA4_9BASI|nr:hypothetical protein VP01_1553g3 [Puccinia sorghi]
MIFILSFANSHCLIELSFLEIEFIIFDNFKGTSTPIFESSPLRFDQPNFPLEYIEGDLFNGARGMIIPSKKLQKLVVQMVNLRVNIIIPDITQEKYHINFYFPCPDIQQDRVYLTLKCLIRFCLTLPITVIIFIFILSYFILHLKLILHYLNPNDRCHKDVCNYLEASPLEAHITKPLDTFTQRASHERFYSSVELQYLTPGDHSLALSWQVPSQRCSHRLGCKYIEGWLYHACIYNSKRMGSVLDVIGAEAEDIPPVGETPGKSQGLQDHKRGHPSLKIIISSPVRLLNFRHIATQHKNSIKRNDNRIINNIFMILLSFFFIEFLCCVAKYIYDSIIIFLY